MMQMRSKVEVAFTLCVLLTAGGCGAHEHTWVDATCTTPKTCSECGQTEGEPLGHTTEVGICHRCGEAQNEDLAQNIIRNITAASDTITNTYSEVRSADTSSLSSLSASISDADVDLQSADRQLDAAQDLCGDYTELSGLKSDIGVARNSTPKPLGTADVNSIKAWLSSYSTYLRNVSSVMDDVSSLAERFVE